MTFVRPARRVARRGAALTALARGGRLWRRWRLKHPRPAPRPPSEYNKKGPIEYWPGKDSLGVRHRSSIDKFNAAHPDEKVNLHGAAGQRRRSSASR